MNVLPILAAATIGLGYFGVAETVNKNPDPIDQAQLVAYPADVAATALAPITSSGQQEVDQAFCGSTWDVTDSLAHDFAETAQETWVHGADLVLQLWASDTMGTWTLLHVGQDGFSCVVSSGMGWNDGVSAADVLALAPIFS